MGGLGFSGGLHLTGEPGGVAGIAGQHQGAFAAGGYATQAGVDLVYSVRPELLELFERIRRNGAHNAALRLHLGAEALTEDGRALTARGRSVTLTGVF